MTKELRDKRGVLLSVGDTIVAGYRGDEVDHLEIVIVESIDYDNKIINTGGLNDIDLSKTEIMVVPDDFSEMLD